MVSVMTPSVAQYSRATSTDYRNFHLSNPNPQGSQARFYGPRDPESSKGFGSPDKTAADLVRFGKKINFGNKMTNEEVLADHLREMRQHLAEKKHIRDMQIEQDKQYLNKVSNHNEIDKKTKMRSSEVLKNEFMFFNDQKQLDNKIRKDQEKEEHKNSRLDYFPFISGELLEQHR